MQNMLKNPVVISVLMIVGGLILFFWPSAPLNTVITLAGIGLAAGGIITLLNWYRTGRNQADGVYSCAGGAVALLCGLFLLFFPQAVKNIVPTLLGIGILVTGIVNLLKAFDQKLKYYPHWGISALLACVTIVLGVIVISNASFIIDTIIRAAGAMLVYSGVSSLWIGTRD